MQELRVPEGDDDPFATLYGLLESLETLGLRTVGEVIANLIKTILLDDVAKSG